MESESNIKAYWAAVLQQAANAIRGYFHSDAYWGDDGEAPQWRKDKQIGTAIKYKRRNY